MITPDDFLSDLHKSMSVRLAAMSFILPIPQGIGALMTYPEDIGEDAALKKGCPILKKDGTPKGSGIVFRNYTDHAFQAVRDNGEEMIIINGISAAEGETLSQFYAALAPDPMQASTADILEMLAFAHTHLGIDDFFNGSCKKIPEFESVSANAACAACGTFLRRSPEERFALLIEGSGAFKGPAASPQKFEKNVILLSNGKNSWLVQTDAFLKTYRTPDDKPIALADIPSVRLQQKPAGKPPAPAA